MSNSQDAEARQPKAHLGLWDTVSIMLGIVIGAGLYETAPLIFQNVSTPWQALGIWAAGGALTLVGALCYAELATAYPRSGGDYVYLTKAFGRGTGFLFGWSQLAVLMTGSIGMMAYIFGNYAARVWDLGRASEWAYGVVAVVILTATNACGVMFGRRTQNLLTWVKVLGLGGILAAGFFWGAPSGALAETPARSAGSIGLAFILVLYTYGGWNDAAFVAAEVADKRRNIPRALIVGSVLLTVIYLLVNSAYLLGLGFAGAQQSKAIAADTLQRPLGEMGARAMSLLVMVSALGAINGLIYTGSRIYSALGTDFRAFSRLAHWGRGERAPVWSLALQALITIALMTLVGSPAGRGALELAFSGLGMGAISWEGHGGFGTLLRCTAPIFWLFFLLTGASLFVLRMREPHVERPFTVPLYPVLPLVFCATCGYMLYAAATYAGGLLIVGLMPVVAGAVFYWFALRPSDARERSSQWMPPRYPSKAPKQT